MSGPWDRPSSDDPDAQWPSEDLGQASDRGPARDPASEGAPGWDDWPPAPPPSDEYVVEEPLPPSSDPWAESWTQEDADAMLRAATREDAPAGDRSDQAQPAEPTVRAEPTPEPVWREPEPEATPAADQPQADTQPPPEPGPRVEPWKPDPDPWSFAPEPDLPTASVQPEPEPEFDPEPEPEPEPEPIPRAEEAASGPPTVARWPSRTEELPDWLAEPTPVAAPSAPAESQEPPAAEAGAEAEPAAVPESLADAPDRDDVSAQPEAEAADTAAEPEVEGETGTLGEVESQPEAQEAGSIWDSILPWRSMARDEQPETPTSDATVGGQAAEQRSAEVDEPQSDAQPPAAEPAIEPRWPASVPEREWAGDPSGDADGDADGDASPKPSDEAPPDEPSVEAPHFVPIGGGLTYGAPADDEAAPAAAAEPAPEPEPEAQPEPVPEAQTIAAAAASWGDLAPPAEPELESQPGRQPEPDPDPDPWAEEGWTDSGDSTRVLPAGWSATTPEARTGELEPSAGPIRTRLAEPDADMDAEAAPTISEQAVPWLIGVILLLAGMVIVLLALIFAGDGSLGGGATSPTPSPSPTLAVVPPGASASATPSESPAATTSEEPSPTPGPTTTPEPIPEYGPLEMVYQGRSAALAPIYLLRRDFTVTDDPAVLAQDSAHDVRRFAWAQDGRVGAGLLADVLVSIEPGEEKRRLGDGLMTITFGDDASTVYAVRITEEGTNDTATVLAVDFITGDTRELADVSYERPELGSEAALAEARFSDEGGPVRLYWMADDVLRLWVLGAGAWTIDPAGGDPTELDGEPLPTLLAPNGRERITAEEADGVTTLTRLDMNDRPLSSTTIEGMVSHLRWSPAGDRVVFTLGRSAGGGGVLQDLFLWDLGDEPPTQLTSTGAAFGAEWLGTQSRWAE